jgi:hypothetical protein
MRASTNAGFRTAGGEVAFPSFGVAGARRPTHFLAASVSIVPGCMTPVVVVCFADDRQSASTGPGQSRANVLRLGVPAEGFVEHTPFWLLPYSTADGVGYSPRE